MIDSDLLVWLNGSFYLILFIYHFKRRRKVNNGILILGILMISNILSILYYNIDYVKSQYGNITISPYIFLFTCNIVSIYPILKYEGLRPQIISTRGLGSFFKFLTIFLGIIGGEVLFENIFFTMKGLKTNYYAIAYSSTEGAHEYLSWFGKKFNFILSMMKNVIVVMFFFNIGIVKNKKLLYLSLFPVGAILSSSLFGGSRGGLAVMILSITSCYLIFKPYIDQRLLKLINKIGLVIISVVVLGFSVITISRYVSSDSYLYRNSIWEWIYLYFGEGPLRFNNDLWSNNSFLYGKNSFNIVTSNLEREKLQILFERKSGLMLEVFYTYIGDFVIDFGFFGAFFICFIINRVLKRLIRKKVLFLADVFILITVYQIFLIGFAAFLFRGTGLMYGALGTLILSMIAYIFRYEKFYNKRF
jgi:oligosaccharide repeat unit polymerase